MRFLSIGPLHHDSDNKVFLTLTCVLLFLVGDSVVFCKKASSNTTMLATNQTDAIERLSQVFGIDRVPVKVFHRSPPQFMIELFNTLTDYGGITKQQSPYNADVIRSFPDRDWTQQLHFYYNVSYLGVDEKILEAEFHVYRMHALPGPTPADPLTRPTPVIEIRVYQVLDTENMHSHQSIHLLDKKLVTAHMHGWIVFRVTEAVKKWLNGTAENHGFLVTSTTLKGQDINGSLRFAQRKTHHESKQPILVVYTDDGRPRRPTYISPNDEDYKEIKEDILKHEKIRNREFQNAIRLLNEKEREEYGHPYFLQQRQEQNDSLSRKKRNTDILTEPATNKPKRIKSKKERKETKKKRRKDRKNKDKRALDFRYRKQRRSCARHEMYVDFDEIGWSGWIISPKGYNAYHCRGECPFPLGQSQKPTNHATVQSIVHALRVGKDVSTPCCVPNKLYSISLLYFDDDENVILKQYDDMVAASCGCH